MRYQNQPYMILSDGTVRPVSVPSELNTVISFGQAILFMIFVAGLIKALASESDEPKSTNLKLLPRNIPKSQQTELEDLVISLREAPTEEDRIFIKLTAPRKVMEQYRSLSSRQIRDIEQRYTQKSGSSPYQAATLNVDAIAVPSDLAWLINDNQSSTRLDYLPTTEATENKVEGILKQLKAGVESIQQSDQFRLFLTTMGKFHDYSIGNMILIMLQKPTSTHVAGFNTWKELGRWVKSGEKGISILAPVFPPAARCEKCGARLPRNAKFCSKCGESIDSTDEGAISPRYFRVVYVFDISQTEGKPLPEFEVPALTGDANEELFSQILVLAKDQNLIVSFESKPEMDPDIKGYYSGKSIWVRPEESRAQQLKTLLHEMAHYYTEGVMGIPRKYAETIAESAAFAVGAHYGFDSGVRSFPYVAVWSEEKKVLEENLAAIRKVTGKIIESLGQLSRTPGREV
ncbi:MAG: ArdC-like ssDNA-binding domain-containing protein [Dehalococcoidales bacterium]|nr:ArdC-like ssDNA-binding domain-containing protein [Dehalococcoidales bacterium]